MLPILIVALVVVIARCIITVMVIAVVVLVVLLVVGRPLFVAYLGAVPPLAVRTIAVVLFAATFAIFAALLIGGTVLFIGRVPNRLVRLGRG